MSLDDLKQIKGAGSTNLVSEYHFGSLDSSQKMRPNASLHFHSAVLLLKCNRKRLVKWLMEMTPAERKQCMALARAGGVRLRQKHQAQELAAKQEEIKLIQDAEVRMMKKKKKCDAKYIKKNMAMKLVTDAKARGKKVKAVRKSAQPNPNYNKLEKDDWIAVAYNDTFHIGCVVSVEEKETVIDFLRKGTTESMFKSLDHKEVVGVDSKFIFMRISGDYVEPKCGGRFLYFSNMDEVKKQYHQYKQYYF